MNKQTIALLIILASSYSFLLSGQKISFKLSPVNVIKTGPSEHAAELTVSYSGLQKEFFNDSSVVIPSENMIITGPLNNLSLSEKNVLYSGVSLDLNNNGRLDDIYKISMKSNKYYMSDKSVYPVISPFLFSGFQIFSYYTESGNPKFSALEKDGMPFIVYSIDLKDKTAAIGTGTRDNPVILLEFPNPNIQVIVAKIAGGTVSRPGFVIEGVENHMSFSNEKLFESQGDDWIAMVWGVMKLDISENGSAKVRISIKNITPPFSVTAYVNFSLEKGITLRSQRSMTVIEK